MSDDLATVASFLFSSEAEVCAAALRSAGIQAISLDGAAVGGLELKGTMGGFRVQVHEADLERARSLLQDAGMMKQARTAPGPNAPDVAFSCEFCGKSLTCPASARDTVQQCPHCDEYVDVPAD